MHGEKSAFLLSRSIDVFLASANKVLNRERNLCLYGNALQKRSFATGSSTDWVSRAI